MTAWVFSAPYLSSASCCIVCVQLPVVKYQLPSEANMYVDLRDDEDVNMMFDEWSEFTAANPGTSAKLYIYIEWTMPKFGDTTLALMKGDDMGMPSGNSAATHRSDSADTLQSPIAGVVPAVPLGYGGAG
jgi:hypothetical protein